MMGMKILIGIVILIAVLFVAANLYLYWHQQKIIQGLNQPSPAVINRPIPAPTPTMVLPCDLNDSCKGQKE